MLIQSVRNILSTLPIGVVPEGEDIARCVREADLAITRLLRG